MTIRRYADYLGDPDQPDAQPPVETPGPAYSPEGVIIIMPDRHRRLWGAIWQGGTKNAPLGEFEGGRDAAITWARQRCTKILIYSDEVQDLVRLPLA